MSIDFVVILGTALIISLIVSAVFLVIYILNAIGLYKMAKNRGMSEAWLAWIPVLNSYVIGNLACPMNFSGKRRNKFGTVLLTLKLIVTLFGLAGFFALCTIDWRMVLSRSNAGSVPLFMPAAASFILIFSLLIDSLCGIVYSVFEYIAYYHLFSHYDKKNGVLYLVLSIVISGIAPIFVFALRNKRFINHYEDNNMQYVNVNNDQNINNINL